MRINARALRQIGLRIWQGIDLGQSMKPGNFNLNNRLLVLGVAVLGAILLYPYDFSLPFRATENTTEERSGGIDFGSSGMLRSAAPPVALYERLITGRGLTLELWLSAASANQRGPARIISYSLDPWHRNFTLGQEGNGLNVRLRTPETDSNGGNPDMEFADIFLPGTMQHVVMTYDFTTQRLYVDGEPRSSALVPRGDFGNWSPSHFLVFGNEATGARPWHGSIAYAAIYDRPLSEETVAARHQAGFASEAALQDVMPLLTFDFTRAAGSRDGAKVAANGFSSMLPAFQKVERIQAESRMIFSLFRSADGRLRLVEEAGAWDLFRNVVLFLPVGFVLFAWVGRHIRSRALTLFATVLVGGVLSASFETMQLFLAERTSSIFDVATNAAGTLIGAMLHLRFSRYSVLR